jgi:enhancing lycopene biosynthesis protein 2
MVKVCVVLSGCGVYDGSEIHEACAALLAFQKAGVEVVCAAPDIEQMHVVNHLTGGEDAGTRSVLEESARIARGKIRSLIDINAADIDAVFFPGGFGAAKNLCTFATQDTFCTVTPQVERIIAEMHARKKPIGAVCIAPVILAKAFEGTGAHPKLTIGMDKATAEKLTGMGARHENRAATEVCVDEDNFIVTGPAYMLASNIAEVFEGVENAVKEVVRLAVQQKERRASA